MLSRAVTGDHILFDECIEAFRRSHNVNIPNNPSASFLLSPFRITSQWDFDICKVHPTVEVNMPGPYKAFISKVDNPTWVGSHNSNLFGIALASIISFVSGKVFKSTRDDYFNHITELKDFDWQTLALQHPILTAGPGAEQTNVSIDSLASLGSKIMDIVKSLNAASYKHYRIALQGIRMVHLSLINKKDDFGLSYSLLISAIEAIGQVAISRTIVNLKHPDESLWKTKAQDDHVFSELLSTYKQARGQNKYLKERYIKFIEKYAPKENWNSYVLHPMAEMFSYLNELRPEGNYESILNNGKFSLSPNQLSKVQIYDILSESYGHRSNFIHRGEQPPHTEPDPMFNIYFQELIWSESEKIEGHNTYTVFKTVLLSYGLLFGICRASVSNWLEEITKT